MTMIDDDLLKKLDAAGVVIFNKGAAPAYHHFTLTRSLVEASCRAETIASMRDLNQFDLCHLPYPFCAISFCPDDFWDNPGWMKEVSGTPRSEATMTACVSDQILWKPIAGTDGLLWPFFTLGNEVMVRALSGKTMLIDTMNDVQHDSDGNTVQISTEESLEVKGICSFAAAVLITSLAASNVEKTTSTNNRATRGIGNGKFAGPNGMIYLSTTKVQTPHQAMGAGKSPRMHYRRGHEHTFLRGEGRSERFKKWVPPMYVNADDPRGLAEPKKYVVTK